MHSVRDHEADSVIQSAPRKRITIIAGAVVTGAALFLLGLGIGGGRINADWFESNNNPELPSSLDFTRVEQLYEALRRNYDGDPNSEELIDGMLHGLAGAAGDPYTTYLNADEAKEFSDQLNGTFSGIGAELGVDEDDNLVIVAPIEGFPASKAGLRPQDRITKVNDESATGLTIFEAVSKIRGPKGSEVKLTILRGNKELEFTITREDITIPSVDYEILDGNIGYLQINQFGDDTAALAEEAARDFDKHNVKGVVLDLRGNPGGLLTAAVDVASLWLAGGAVVLQQKTGDTVISTETAKGNNILSGVPTVVLINEGSASASEIVAGALKDNETATIVGIKSYGKGSVQEIHTLPDGGELKVTVARWYRPNGENIDKKGVSPDREIKMTEEDYQKDRDPQKNAALKLLR